MSSPLASPYTQLTQTWGRLHRLAHAQAIVWWDQQSMMPAAGNEARSAALAELSALLHGIRTDAKIKELLDAAEAEPLEALQRANLREMRRDWRAANALPPALVEAKVTAGSRCEHAWRTQRPANDWNGFLANFREVVKCAREEASFLSDETGLAKYDALMDNHEPGMTGARLDQLFGDLLTWLPDLVRRVRDRQARQNVIAPRGPFPRAAQQAVGLAAMRLLGFDFAAGRLDESAHPFCGGVPEDVRLTTRYREDDFVGSLMGVIHETGHGRYEQNLPRDLLGQPVSWARSAGIHESQSLSFEMQIGLSRAFVGLLAPLLERHFGAQPAFEAENLYQHFIRVAPGFIRVEADELTYPLHVILRYRIERALIEGEIEADDITAMWDQAIQDLLDLDTSGNYRDGCMQDVHWSEGLFGYFPSYTLGAMYAAQWFAAIRRAVPDLDPRMAAGDLSPALDWLKAKVWSQGSLWTTDELVTRATGSPLDASHYRRHLEARYLA
jgi:carboxypeptidase Taq